MPTDAAESVWDPAGETVSNKTFAGVCKACKDKLDWYRAHPAHLRHTRVYLGLIIIPGILIAVAMFYTGFVDEKGRMPMYIAFGSFMPVTLYIAYVKNLQTDLVKMLIAEKRNWIYNPSDRTDKWRMLKKAFPSIFGVGDSGQSVADEFWGTATSRFRTYPFWLGMFEYTTGHGKHKQTHTREVVAFRLPRAVPTDFGLREEGMGLWLRETLGKRDIQTESADFNKRFAVDHAGEKSAVEAGIVQVLSPAVQTGLLDLHSRIGKFHMRFQGDAMVCSCMKFLPKTSHTDLFRKPELDSRDSEEMDKAFDSMLGVVDEVVRYVG